MNREAATANPSRMGVHARHITTGVLVSFGLVLLAGVVFWHSAWMQTTLSRAALPTASLLAAVMSLLAWRRLASAAGTAWLFFGVAAVLATVSHFGALLPPGISQIRAIHLLWLGAYGLLLAGVVSMVHHREGGRLGELLLDGALLVTAGALVILEWAPGARSVAGVPGVTPELLLAVFAPAAALAALLVIGVLLTGPRNSFAPGALVGMAGCILSLFLSTVPQLVNGSSCCHPGSPAIFTAIGVWAFLIAGSSSAWAAGNLSVPPPTRERLRQLVAPLVAIVLAAVSLEAALNPPLAPKTGVALGVLGALVALRLTELLYATRMQVSERRELAQTRALVEVSRALAGQNDLDTTLQIVTRWAARVLNARAAALELLSADSRTLILRAAHGLPEEAIGMEFPVEGSFTGWVVLHGEARVTSRSDEDPYITPASAEFLGNSPVAAMPLRYRERLLGVLSCVGNRPFAAADLDLLRAFANQAALALEDARLFDQVRALSLTDPLTSLANRRQMDRELTREFAAAQRGRKLVAVMFDLDDFKLYNDSYGHVAGDEALRLFGEALRSMTRTMNFAARYGGDEFFALLADANAQGAETFVARVKKLFYQKLDAIGSPPIHVSAGMAEYGIELVTPADLIAAADRALYASKHELGVNS